MGKDLISFTDLAYLLIQLFMVLTILVSNNALDKGVCGKNV